jgi:hypothetical protein
VDETGKEIPDETLSGISTVGDLSRVSNVCEARHGERKIDRATKARKTKNSPDSDLPFPLHVPAFKVSLLQKCVSAIHTILI